MRNIHNALTDTIESLGLTHVVQDSVNPVAHRQWILKIESLPNALVRSFLEIEVIEEDDGDASVCVLRRHNVGRRVMARILNRLVDKLDDDLIYDLPLAPPPSQEERASPAQ